MLAWMATVFVNTALVIKPIPATTAPFTNKSKLFAKT